MTRTARFFVASVCVVALAGCGGSDGGETAPATQAAEAPTQAPATEAPAPATEAPAPATEAPAPATEPAAPATDAAPAAGATIEVSLAEWSITPSGEIPAGPVTFNAVNAGQFPHQLTVVQGSSYAELPLSDAGAIKLDELPAGALMGTTENFGPGAGGSIAAEMAPGTYVMVCNIAMGGGQGHAARGQVFEFTVA